MANLIVGSDSLVGKALIKYYRKTGSTVFGTTRRHNLLNDFCCYLDIKDDVGKWHFPHPIDTAILCAGVTKLDACRNNPEMTALINVSGIIKLVKNLVSRGVFVIYLSTSQVFDGTIQFCPYDTPFYPLSEYGRQKAAVEKEIRLYGDSVAIVRITKIFGSNIPLIHSWSDALLNGRTIHPFSDMTIAPVPLSCVVSILKIIADLHLSGIFQISGNEDISYLEAAKIGAESLGVDSCLIQEIKSTDFGYSGEPIPPYTTLDMSRIKEAVGIAPPDAVWTIQKAFTNPELLDVLAIRTNRNESK